VITVTLAQMDSYINGGNPFYLYASFSVAGVPYMICDYMQGSVWTHALLKVIP